MLKLAILIAGIGLADSVNPATIGPALYFATITHPVRRVTEFTAGFFVVNFVAGVLIVIGPGQLLVELAQRPGPEVTHIVELVGGVILIATAIGLFLGRTRLAASPVSGRELQSRHAWGLGLGLGAAELPTAFPYFAALAAIIGSGLSLAEQIALVFLFNFVFVAPKLVIIGGIVFGGERGRRWLQRAGDWVRLHWPVVFAWIALIAGLALVAVGLSWLLEH